MSGNVVSLGKGTAFGEPVKPVIDMLRDLLEQAESGYIRGLAIVAIGEGVTVKTDWCGDGAQGTGLGHGISYLQYRFNQAVDMM